ncbi:hypothetical protein [Croceicoccus mobilis]|uniref:Uncharacterized protein n=1 Tax=Croceicoccus mobilis TaxID=1703339 RepID=A0A916Z4J4_9SPHN|nr:hypothetical protein [Croceicoccus mobilis]GGD76448.1 hypothetical protein GCM10010990_27670 [Croceicoccus mobilis]
MAAQDTRNYRFAGIAFLAVALMFFYTKNAAMGATFLALGAVFVALSQKGAQKGKKDGE